MDMFFRNLFSNGAAPVSDNLLSVSRIMNFRTALYYRGKQVWEEISDFNYKSSG